MKLNKFIAASLLFAGALFASCGTAPIGGNDPDRPVDTTNVTVDTVAIPTSIALPEGAITVSEARQIAAALESGTTTGQKYYVHGWVKKLHDKHTQETIDQYGNGQFYMSETKLSDGTYDNDDFMAYQVYGLGGQKLVSMDQVAEGDYVVIYGELTNFNGTYETVGRGAAYIYASTNPKIGDAPEPQQPIDIDYEANEMSVTDFLALDAVKTLATGVTTEELYTVRGKVKDAKVNLGYGSATFYITDGVNDLYCYGIVDIDSTLFVNGARIVDGDIVTVHARVQNYSGTIELVKGWLTRTTNTTEAGKEAEIKEITLAEARQIALGQANKATTTEQYKFKGVVSLTAKEFTKTSSDVNNTFGNLTFFLVDENGENEFVVYRAYYLDNKKYDPSTDPAIEDGDVVTVIGQLMNYNSTPETPQGGAYVAEHIK